jgi:hypothetical protein
MKNEMIRAGQIGIRSGDAETRPGSRDAIDGIPMSCSRT